MCKVLSVLQEILLQAMLHILSNNIYSLHTYVLRPICKTTHFVNWAVRLPSSRNGQFCKLGITCAVVCGHRLVHERVCERVCSRTHSLLCCLHIFCFLFPITLPGEWWAANGGRERESSSLSHQYLRQVGRCSS